MVSIIKQHTPDSRGVCIFSHKELDLLKELFSKCDVLSKKLKQQYVIGMHWGSYYPSGRFLKDVDFHLATESTVNLDGVPHERIIPLQTRNFIPGYFEPYSADITWDVIVISTPNHFKKLNFGFEVFRNCIERGMEIKVLIISPIRKPPSKMKTRYGDDTEFFESYNSHPHVNKHIDLVCPWWGNGADLIPHEILPYLYNASKCLALFSEKEGESRVIHEALMCGTPVVVREDLKGGGRDYLDETNSFQFGTLDEAVEIFTEIAESEDVGFDPSYLRKSLSAEYTTDQLEAELRDVFDSLGEPFEGQIDTENLEFKLPGHVATLPDGIGSDTSNDLRNLMQLYRFVEYATDADLPEGRLFLLRLLTTDLLSVRLPRWMKTRVEVMIRILDDKLPLPIYEELWHLYHRLRS